MSLTVENKNVLKKDIKELLSKIIPKPNKDVLSVTASYDPNLNVVTLSYISLNKEERCVIIDELLDD